MKAQTNDLRHPPILKRKIGYQDESEDETRNMPETVRMNVDRGVV